MSKYTIEITEPAEKDLYEIGRYIAIELLEPTVAKKIVGKISEAILNIIQIRSKIQPHHPHVDMVVF